MTREELIRTVERQVWEYTVPGDLIPKGDGLGVRPVEPVSEKEGITVRTGVRTQWTRTVTPTMIHYAIEVLAGGGEFNKEVFCMRYSREYAEGPCLISAIGGLFTRLGL